MGPTQADDPMPTVEGRLADAIRTLGREREFPRGAALFAQDEAERAVHLVREGTVRCCRLSCEGRRQITRFAGPGDVLALVAGTPMDEGAEAVTLVRTWSAPRAAFEAALKADPGLRDAAFERMARELTQTRDLLMVLGQMNATERTAAFLYRAARGRTELSLPMTREDIADHLGLTLETVSRMLGRLRREGIVDMPRPGLVRITDAAALDHMAQAA